MPKTWFLFHIDYFSISGEKAALRVKIKRVMADYVILRRGRNALSTATHAMLNIGLAVMSTILTVVSANWVFAILLVLLSKWRILAVRPRYWWLNVKANLVDLTVGISLAILVYLANPAGGLNLWQIILTIIYAVWLVVIKPLSTTRSAELQALFAIFFGSFVVSLITAQLDPIVGVIVCFIIGYGATRHVLMQGDDHDFTLTTFIFGMMMSELYWICYHWTIAYQLGRGMEGGFITGFSIPQFPIIATIMLFVFSRGYKSAVRHDGKIRIDDILAPALFSALIMIFMVFFYSVPNFNI